MILPVMVLAQPGGPSYHPLQLDCAHYRQRVRSEIQLESGRRRSRETAGRDGTLVVQAMARDSALFLEAWFDTLVVWREGSGERLEPGTDGVIGGRFKGVLTRLGGFASLDRPFVPEDVAQVADVGDALEELFPPLPAEALLPGAAWKDEFGNVFTRLTDGMNQGHPVERYRLIRRSEREESRWLPDSTEVRATRQQAESGVYEWSGELGPIRWEREITVEVSVPAGGVVKTPFRTRIVQQVIVERVAGYGTPATCR